MRRLAVLVVFVVVGALLVVADLAATAVAEQRLSDRITRALEAPAEAELHGWPMTAHLLLGRLPRVDVTARDVPLGTDGATIDRLDVVLSDVTVRWQDLTGETEELPPAREARFEAHVSEATAQALLGLPDEVVGVELQEGVVVIDVAGLAQVEADVTAQDGVLVVRPRDGLAGLVGLAEIPIDLRDQPGGPHVQEARVSDGRIVLSGTLTDVEGPGGG